MGFRIAAFLLVSVRVSNALSLPNGDGNTPPSDLSQSRRNLAWKLPLGAVGTYAYGRLVYNALSVTEFKYPAEHEKRVESTVLRALSECMPVASSRPLRVLEVGIGDKCALLRRGLYTPAFNALEARGVTRIELTGVDIKPPSKEVIADTRQRTSKAFENKDIAVDFNVIKESITTRLPFETGYFDSVISSFTLCSVDDPFIALQEIKRLLRLSGGTFGYIEHVAVEADEPYRFLELQQNLFDPLQQLVADNCHLHRHTEKSIFTAFGVGDSTSQSREVESERFLVNNMWPVSCQTCGVIKRNG